MFMQMKPQCYCIGLLAFLVSDNVSRQLIMQCEWNHTAQGHQDRVMWIVDQASFYKIKLTGTVALPNIQL